jgi:hypothetical protein
MQESSCTSWGIGEVNEQPNTFNITVWKLNSNVASVGLGIVRVEIEIVTTKEHHQGSITKFNILEICVLGQSRDDILFTLLTSVHFSWVMGSEFHPVPVTVLGHTLEIFTKDLRINNLILLIEPTIGDFLATFNTNRSSLLGNHDDIRLWFIRGRRRRW